MHPQGATKSAVAEIEEDSAWLDGVDKATPTGGNGPNTTARPKKGKGKGKKKK